MTSYIVYVVITGSVAVSYVPISTFPDSEMEFSTENIENVPYRTYLNCSTEGKVLHNCEWGLVGTEYQKVQTNKRTRLTFGRVKPLLDLHRLCARNAIMIPFKVWVWKTIPSSSKFLLSFNTSLMFHKVLGFA